MLDSARPCERCPMHKSKDIDIREYKEIDVSKPEDKNRVKCTGVGVVV